MIGKRALKMCQLMLEARIDGRASVVGRAAARPAAAGVIVETWGINFDGELGNGTTSNQSNVPVVVSGLSDGVTAGVGGDDHTLALQNGGILAWGSNSNGQLGDGTATDHITPAPVSVLTSGVTAIAASDRFSLAIENGAAYGWGKNDHGQLGNGMSLTAFYPTPAPVVGLSSGVTAISAGGAGRHSDSKRCRLGVGWKYQWPQHTSRRFSGLSSGVTAIAASGQGPTLAVKNGVVSEWSGPNQSPMVVAGLPSGATSVAAGFDSYFAVVGGHVWAWGDDQTGELGDGMRTQFPPAAPEEIDPTDLVNIIAMSSGADSTYALSSDGSFWEWGSNNFGELGLGTASGFTTPQHILPPAGYEFTSVNTGSDGLHVIAVLTETPEPASASLLTIGAIGLLVRRRRTAPAC